MDDLKPLNDLEMNAFYTPEESRIAREKFKTKYFSNVFKSDKFREDAKTLDFMKRMILKAGSGYRAIPEVVMTVIITNSILK
jgi:hypothetical protein